MKKRSARKKRKKNHKNKAANKSNTQKKISHFTHQKKRDEKTSEWIVNWWWSLNFVVVCTAGWLQGGMEREHKKALVQFNERGEIIKRENEDETIYFLQHTAPQVAARLFCNLSPSFISFHFLAIFWNCCKLLIGWIFLFFARIKESSIESFFGFFGERLSQ